MQFLLRDLISNITPVQVIAHHLGGGDYAHSYRGAIVAEYEQMVVGMVLSYASLFPRIIEEMQEFFPKDRLEHLRSFYSPWVENSLFLDALCVEKEFRAKGIGSELMCLTEKRAKENRCDVIYKVKEWRESQASLLLVVSRTHTATGNQSKVLTSEMTHSMTWSHAFRTKSQGCKHFASQEYMFLPEMDISQQIQWRPYLKRQSSPIPAV